MIVNTLEVNKEALADIQSLMLDEQGRILPVPFKEINKFSQNDISAFCVQQAIYQVPTIELLQWLESEIPDKSTTIEIGAGNGCVGRNLGIRMYDNFHQDNEMMQFYYATIGQPTVKYGSDVIRMNGNKAVNILHPETVIACWVTQKFQKGDDIKKVKIGSNMYGVNELDFIGKIRKYIHVGNTATHHDKRILSKVWFREYKFPWLISRSMSREKNVIHVFKCHK